MATATEFQSQVNKTELNMARFDQFVNGAESEQVSTDRGPLPTLARIVDGSTAPMLLTRDRYFAMQQKIRNGRFGTSVMANGFPTNFAKVPLNVAIFGDSVGAGQGASTNFTPASQITAAINYVFPEFSPVVKVYAIPGSWQAQMYDQIAKMITDGFVPDLCIIISCTNDGRAPIWHSLQGPLVFNDILYRNIGILQQMGATVWTVSKPLPHPTRSLAGGIFDASPDFFISYPSTSFVAGDGFQRFDYSLSRQSITSSTGGQFKIYANGWLAPGQYVRIDERVFGRVLFARITDWDAPGTTLFVDDGAGRPIIPSDASSTVGLYQARINERTQLIPARNENDLSRPAGVAANIPLSVEPRDLNGNGVMINCSLRHLVLNSIQEQVSRQRAVTCLPWAQEVHRQFITSNAGWDTIYPNGEFLHYGDNAYGVLGTLFRRELQKLAYAL